MPIWIRDAGTWKSVDSDQLSIRDGSTWKDVKEAWIRDAGVWKSVYIRSDPQMVSYDLLGWGQAYYGNVGGSGKIPDSQSAKGNYAFRYGWGYNNEDEFSMLGFSGAVITTLEANITERPVISLITLRANSQHTQNSAAKTCYFGWHGNTSEPALGARLHTETHSSWSSGAISVPHNTANAGTEFSFNFPSSVHTTISAQIIAGNIAGITGGWSAASASADWGWMTGMQMCSDEVSGGCGGTWSSAAGDSNRMRIEITSDYI
jgi:hypothetical protein